MTEFSFTRTRDTWGPLQGNNKKQELPLGDCSTPQHNPFHYCPCVRDEGKGSGSFFDLPKTTQEVNGRAGIPTQVFGSPVQVLPLPVPASQHLFIPEGLPDTCVQP